MKLLIENGASKDICDQMERSPREVAEERKHDKVVSFLDSASTQRLPQLNVSVNGSALVGQSARCKKPGRKTNRVWFCFSLHSCSLFLFYFLIAVEEKSGVLNTFTHLLIYSEKPTPMLN